MNIAVISPHGRNTGNTTLAILIALDLAQKGKRVCMTNANNMSHSLYEYFNLMDYEDKTSTPSQVVKLLKEGSVKPEEVSDYCKKISDNLELFCNNAKDFTESDMQYMIEYIGSKLTHDYIIYDIDIGMNQFPYHEMTKKIIGISDMVILNINQSIKQLTEINRIKKDMLELLGNKPTIVVISRFDDSQSTIKETANWMGVKKPNNWLVMRNNPWICWGTNHGKITQVYKKIIEKDERVMDVASDLDKISNNIIKNNKYNKGKTGEN